MKTSSEFDLGSALKNVQDVLTFMLLVGKKDQWLSMDGIAHEDSTSMSTDTGSTDGGADMAREDSEEEHWHGVTDGTVAARLLKHGTTDGVGTLVARAAARSRHGQREGVRLVRRRGGRGSSRMRLARDGVGEDDDGEQPAGGRGTEEEESAVEGDGGCA